MSLTNESWMKPKSEMLHPKRGIRSQGKGLAVDGTFVGETETRNPKHCIRSAKLCTRNPKPEAIKKVMGLAFDGTFDEETTSLMQVRSRANSAQIRHSRPASLNRTVKARFWLWPEPFFRQMS